MIGAEVIDFDAILGEDGYTYSLANGTDRVARTIPCNKSRGKGSTIDGWQLRLPIFRDDVKLHRIMLGAVDFFGGSVHEEFHHEEGGVL